MALNMNNSRETRVRELWIPANSRYTRLHQSPPKSRFKKLSGEIENIMKVIVIDCDNIIKDIKSIPCWSCCKL